MAQTHNEPSHGMTLYRLRDAAVIARVMQELVEQQAVLSLYAAQSAEELDVAVDTAPVALASLSRTDVRQSALVLKIPAQPQPLPQRLIGIAHMAGGVRVQCAIDGNWQPEAGALLLHMPWPQELLQLQRRRHQRFPVPLGQNYTASFLFGHRRCVLDIHDISEQGLALRGSRTETAMLFMGRTLPKVELYLGAEKGVIAVDVQVRSRRSYCSFLLGPQVLVGVSIARISQYDRKTLDEILSIGIHRLSIL